MKIKKASLWILPFMVLSILLFVPYVFYSPEHLLQKIQEKALEQDKISIQSIIYLEEKDKKEYEEQEQLLINLIKDHQLTVRTYIDKKTGEHYMDIGLGDSYNEKYLMSFEALYENNYLYIQSEGQDIPWKFYSPKLEELFKQDTMLEDLDQWKSVESKLEVIQVERKGKSFKVWAKNNTYEMDSSMGKVKMNIAYVPYLGILRINNEIDFDNYIIHIENLIDGDDEQVQMAINKEEAEEIQSVDDFMKKLFNFF